MIVRLLFNFLLIGVLSFGGGYSTIPLVKDIVDKFDVLNLEMLENFIAISESTPGPIAVNLATFVGIEVAGILGGILATLCEVLPAFLIILLVAKYFKKYVSNANVRFALSVIRPCIIGIIMMVGLNMYINNFVSLAKDSNKSDALIHDYGAIVSDITHISTYINIDIIKYIIVTFAILLVIFVGKYVFKKKISTIYIIILGAIFGVAINYVL